jgi:phosphate transport system ATP-binding protein
VTPRTPGSRARTVFELRDVGVAYAGKPAVADVSMDIHRNDITALIGPSGCGKSTLLRSLNRMNDLIPTASVSGTVLYHDQDLYGLGWTLSRCASGSAWSSRSRTRSRSRSGERRLRPQDPGMKDVDGRVERALKSRALWDEVKDRLDENASACPGGQQQRLCIARALAVDPTCSSWTSPAPPSTRSPPARSRT